MEHQDIKKAEIVGFCSNGTLKNGELCYQTIQIKLDGKLYHIRQTPTKHPVIYLEPQETL